MNGGAEALATSLLLARVRPHVSQAPEQQLLERLHAATSSGGSGAADLVTALYVGLKLHWWTIVCGPPRERAMRCLDTVATAFVGASSGQTLRLHGPVGHDMMQQRFAALRLGDFVATALEQGEQSTAWFILADAPGDPTPLLRWIRRELDATLRANGRPAGILPANIFVLAAASTGPEQPDRCWLTLAAPDWADSPAERATPLTPPVGYQRQLLGSQLGRGAYRRRLRDGDLWQAAASFAQCAALPRSTVARWLAASVDERGQGLWVRDDRAANARKALSVLGAGAVAPVGYET